MVSRLRHRAGLGALLVVVALAAAACGGNGSDGGGTDAGGTEEELSGTIAISGSSTVEPISTDVAEKFQEQNPGVQISVQGPGTGDGFQAFCNGDIDIADASRQINDEELAACQGKGIEFIELKVGIDGLSVITSTANADVTCLNFGDLYALLGPESQGFDTWDKAESLAGEVGGNGNFPAAPLVVTAPGEESGTYDSFIEIALGDIIEEREQEEATRPDYQSSSNDNQIIEGIAGNNTSLGWVGYAFASQNTDKVKLLEVAAEGSDCVAPSPETIASGEFPLARDLYIYANKAKVDQNPALAAYVDYYLSDEGLASVTEAGYVALADADKAETTSTWQAKTTGKKA